MCFSPPWLSWCPLQSRVEPKVHSLQWERQAHGKPSINDHQVGEMAISPLRYEHEGAVLQKRDQIPLSSVGDEQSQKMGTNGLLAGGREVLGGGGVILNLERRVEFS